MRFLIDKSPKDVARKIGLYPSLVEGQLLTPLTRYKNAGGVFAIDNGAFSGFDRDGFAALLKREEPNREHCLFVTVPDVVEAGRRTLEIWKYRHSIVRHWPLALVAQDGMEDLEIPWGEMKAVFIGGGDPWKDSKSALDIVKTAKTLGKHVHVGRVNTAKRFKLFAEAGADTCDGSGVSMYDHMLDNIAKAISKEPERSLFDNKELQIDCETHV
jgi:hypothetical protein